MLQITFRNMPSSKAIWDLAEQKFGRLREGARDPMRCYLVVEHQPGCARKDEQFCAHAEVACGVDSRIAATAYHEQACAAVRMVFAHVDRQLASRRARQDATAL